MQTSYKGIAETNMLGAATEIFVSGIDGFDVYSGPDKPSSMVAGRPRLAGVYLSRGVGDSRCHDSKQHIIRTHPTSPSRHARYAQYNYPTHSDIGRVGENM